MVDILNSYAKFSWKVKRFDSSLQEIKDYDVLARQEASFLALRRAHPTQESFAEAVRIKLMSQFWSRCEYELLIGFENDKLYLWPWVGALDKDIKLEVQDEEAFNWKAFAEDMLSRTAKTTSTKVKFDIWDQLNFYFEKLVEFCWNFPYKDMDIAKPVGCRFASFQKFCPECRRELDEYGRSKFDV